MSVISVTFNRAFSSGFVSTLEARGHSEDEDNFFHAMVSAALDDSCLSFQFFTPAALAVSSGIASLAWLALRVATQEFCSDYSA